MGLVVPYRRTKFSRSGKPKRSIGSYVAVGALAVFTAAGVVYLMRPQPAPTVSANSGAVLLDTATLSADDQKAPILKPRRVARRHKHKAASCAVGETLLTNGSGDSSCVVINQVPAANSIQADTSTPPQPQATAN